MKVDVIFQDNSTGQVEEALLEEMISGDKISMFLRSDGWAVVGVDDIRGSSGMCFYAGPDRRGLNKKMENRAYRDII